MTVFFFVLQFTGSMPYISGSDSAAFAQGDWKQQFAEVCGKTQNAMELSKDDLRNSIERCNKLEQRLHELNGPEGSEKKVYAHRLKMCKDLYVFTLEHKEKQETENNEK
ncbi:MAG: hypothetical protein SCH71_02275 [Desulfobulbaceae bacterium]|nr:hypothetical protein [Desulfobulbaceae bacterium]